MAEKNQDLYLLTSVSHSLEILDLLSDRDSLTIAEICKELHFGRSSVFRILYTLEKGHYVLKDENARYSLGYKFASYGAKVSKKQDIVAVSRPYMRRLRDAFNETTQLGVLTDAGKVVFIAKETGNFSIQMNAAVWLEKEAYSMASGKVMLAQRPADEQLYFAERYDYKPFTENTIRGQEQLLAQLSAIKSAGYAADLEEGEPGLVCYAAPIYNCAGNCEASLSISGPSARMYPMQNRLVDAVRQAARDISAALGYFPEKS